MPGYENSTSHMSSGNHIIYPCTGSFCLNRCVYVRVVYHVFLINLQTGFPRLPHVPSAFITLSPNTPTLFSPIFLSLFNL